ncbi:MAG: 3D domain-containing protein [Pyrinomonadaceae bacterium]
MKPLFSGGALVATALFSGSLLLWAQPLEAETLSPQSQEQKKQQLAQATEQEPLIGSASLIASPSSEVNTSSRETPKGDVREISRSRPSVLLPVSYVATAYSLRGKTASGKYVSKGLIAADPRFLPLGSRIRLEAGAYSGDYLVADTGSLIKGRKIDIWTPSSREAMRFGRRKVKLTVLSYGAKRSVRKRRAGN